MHGADELLVPIVLLAIAHRIDKRMRAFTTCRQQLLADERRLGGDRLNGPERCLDRGV